MCACVLRIFYFTPNFSNTLLGLRPSTDEGTDILGGERDGVDSEGDGKVGWVEAEDLHTLLGILQESFLQPTCCLCHHRMSHCLSVLVF